MAKFHGNGDERAWQRENTVAPGKFDVCVTSYEMARALPLATCFSPSCCLASALRSPPLPPPFLTRSPLNPSNPNPSNPSNNRNNGNDR